MGRSLDHAAMSALEIIILIASLALAIAGGIQAARGPKEYDQ